MSSGPARYDVQMKWRRRINRAAFALLLASLIVWLATGRAIYTRFPDARRAALEPLQQQDDNLWPVGAEPNADSRAATRADEFPNRFMLGLLPSGGGRYWLSVSSMVLVTSFAWLGCYVRQKVKCPS